MIMKKLFTFSVGVVALTLSSYVFADLPATDSVRAKQVSLNVVAKWPRKVNRVDAVFALWRGWGDWSGIAEASVGTSIWGKLEVARRVQLAGLLSDIAALNWLRRVDVTPDWNLTWLREEATGRRRVVVALLKMGENTVDLRWVVQRRGEDWQLVDMVTEGASLVVAQRTSFARVLDKGGVNRLFLRLEQKRADLMKEVLQ
jgi:hypothetical protein